MDLALASMCVAAGAALGGVVTAAVRRVRSAAVATAAADSPATEPLRLIAEHLPVAVLLFGVNGRIRFANRLAEDMLYAGESLADRNFLSLVATAPPPVSRALTGVGDSLFTLDEAGAPQTFQVLRSDVELEGAPHTLMLLNAITREVAGRELDVLKTVIRVISHELNNSLASMSSLVSSGRFIAANPDKLSNLPRVFDGIEDRTRHLQRFLNEYAQLSRMPEPRVRAVSWPPVLARLRQLYPEVQLDEPDTPSAWADEAQLEQALLNLLKNAHEAGGPTTEVRVVVRVVDQLQEIGVLDRGTGFSPEALEHGLLPYYSTKPGGSGVGLALCREVAAGHGGSLRIKNREGGGSAVYLVLPLAGRDRRRDKPLSLTLTST